LAGTPPLFDGGGSAGDEIEFSVDEAIGDHKYLFPDYKKLNDFDQLIDAKKLKPL
jgi:hypothetical protein